MNWHFLKIKIIAWHGFIQFIVNTILFGIGRRMKERELSQIIDIFPESLQHGKCHIWCRNFFFLVNLKFILRGWSSDWLCIQIEFSIFYFLLTVFLPFVYMCVHLPVWSIFFVFFFPPIVMIDPSYLHSFVWNFLLKLPLGPLRLNMWFFHSEY